MLAAAGILALATLAYTARPPVEWWKSSVLYQIYPRSFSDSDGDGNGDLKGILNHVDYLKDLGVGIVWLSPIYDSPMKDQGYDVSDFLKVNPLFGNLEDAKALIEAFHKNGMKFFMDFVPNHSSNEHAWFNLSRNKDPYYGEFYVWRGSKLPNNWLSNFNGKPAWTYDTVRKEFYLHQFGDYQPDLNYGNSRVIDAMFKNMEYWFDLGVDGFRMDAVPFLVEDSMFHDEPVLPDCTGENCLDHIYTQNLKGTYDVLRDLQDRIERKYNSTKFLYLEVYANEEQTKKYYYKNSAPFNFRLVTEVGKTTNATALKDLVDSFMKSLPEKTWPSWVLGNHDQSRVGTRLGPDFIDAANMLVLLLPGSSVTFQGEEMGMIDADIPKKRVIDCCGRDPERTPFQWDTTEYAGFSTSTNGTWLPVNSNYYSVNVKSESQNDTSSHLQTYKRLLGLRQDLVSNIEIKTATIGDWVFVFTRTNGDNVYYVIINLNNIETEVSLKAAFSDIPGSVTVHTPSSDAGFKIGDAIDSTKKITLRPRSGLVVSGSPVLLSSLCLLLSALAFLVANRD